MLLRELEWYCTVHRHESLQIHDGFDICKPVQICSLFVNKPRDFVRQAIVASEIFASQTRRLQPTQYKNIRTI